MSVPGDPDRNTPGAAALPPPFDVSAAADGVAAASPGAPILSVNNIEVVYDHVILVLKGVSLAVPIGAIVALLGANGAGKSTTLKAISNLLSPDRGDVTNASITFDVDQDHTPTPND